MEGKKVKAVYVCVKCGRESEHYRNTCPSCGSTMVLRTKVVKESNPSDAWLEEAGWTREDWNELVATLGTKNHEKILSLLERYKGHEFGTPLALDIMKILEVPDSDVQVLVEEYGDLIPVSEILKRAC
jgi:DNA-directed RNA polymerase subunit RPC12/RpoP